MTEAYDTAMTEVELRKQERTAIEALSTAIKNWHEKRNLFVMLEILQEVVSACDELIDETEDGDPGRHRTRKAICERLLRASEQADLDYSTD